MSECSAHRDAPERRRCPRRHGDRTPSSRRTCGPPGQPAAHGVPPDRRPAPGRGPRADGVRQALPRWDRVQDRDVDRRLRPPDPGQREQLGVAPGLEAREVSHRRAARAQAVRDTLRRGPQRRALGPRADAAAQGTRRRGAALLRGAQRGRDRRRARHLRRHREVPDQPGAGRPARSARLTTHRDPGRRSDEQPRPADRASSAASSTTGAPRCTDHPIAPRRRARPRALDPAPPPGRGGRRGRRRRGLVPRAGAGTCSAATAAPQPRRAQPGDPHRPSRRRRTDRRARRGCPGATRTTFLGRRPADRRAGHTAEPTSAVRRPRPTVPRPRDPTARSRLEVYDAEGERRVDYPVDVAARSP